MSKCGDQPCASLTFLEDPPIKSAYSPTEVREKFLSFFERNDHKRIGKYPIIARWREDVYFVGATIYDFQPWVTEGLLPPPANPLVISQPCVRFTDIDLVGKSGRHLTNFEMMSHHAFNYPRKFVYWNDETADYCFQFFTSVLRIHPSRINFIEDMWIGGGNAGEDLEVVVGGIELATLVFMHYKQSDSNFIPLRIMTVDTGYGLERIVWLTQRTATIYDAIFKPVINMIRTFSGINFPDEKILVEASKTAGLIDLKGENSLRNLRIKVAEKLGLSLKEIESLITPVENVYAVADFTRTLIFLLGDGIVPSNTESGYLARLLIRKIIRSLMSLGIQENFNDILKLQIEEVSKDYPEYREKSDLIHEMVDAEEKRFLETLERGKILINRIVDEEKSQGKYRLSTETLVKLYDSHGLTPDYVSQIAKEQNINVEIPDDFYSKVAQLHEKVEKPSKVDDRISMLKEKIQNLPSTQLIYYRKPYIEKFKAEVLKILEDKYVILDKTAFYPEGGGQPADVGILKMEKSESKVVDVQKIGNIVVHQIEGIPPPEGSDVVGEIDWDRRLALMRNHTATHILLASARKILGDHVWQAGTTKGVEKSRLDITHYLRLTDEQIQEIESEANQIVMRNLPVKTTWLKKEVAEARYGFKLYQGGVVPERKIRVVNILDWDAEACAGVHCKTTSEIGMIKIVRTERIQDGVERIFFSVGDSAFKYVTEIESKLKHITKVLGCSLEEVEKAVEVAFEETKSARKEIEKLKSEIAKRLTSDLTAKTEVYGKLKLLRQIIDSMDVKTAIKTCAEAVRAQPNLVAVFILPENETARIIVMAGDEAIRFGINAGEISAEASEVAGGSGGGKPQLGQGGKLVRGKIQDALNKVEEILRIKGGI